MSISDLKTNKIIFKYQRNLRILYNYKVRLSINQVDLKLGRGALALTRMKELELKLFVTAKVTICQGQIINEFFKTNEN